MIKPYNPKFHNSIVDNIRANAKAAGLSTEHRTDEQIYDLFQDCYFCEDCEAEILLTLQAEQAKPPK